MKLRLIPTLVVISILAASTLACGLGPQAKEWLGREDNSSTDIQPTQRGETEQSQPVKATPDQSQPAEKTETGPSPDITEAPQGAPENAQLISGLDKLDSYHLNMVIKTFELDAGGQTIEKTMEITNDVDTITGDEHIVMTTSGDSSDSADGSSEGLSNIEIVTVNDTTYILFPGEDGTVSCMSSPTDESETEDYSAGINEIFGSMENLKLVKKGEMVNGVETDKYTFDEKNLKNARLTKAKGDVWIAQDGGFVVKMTATGTGTETNDDNDDNDEGKIVDYDITYNLEDINQTITITAPDACEQGLPDDLPMPASATIEVSMEGFYSLKSTESSAVIADFYRLTLPEQGWEITSDSSLETMYTFEFGKNGKIYSMMITASDTGCDIMITVQP